MPRVGAPRTGTVVVVLASASGDRLSPAALRVGGARLSIGGVAPKAPDASTAGQLALAPGRYDASIDGVPGNLSLDVTADQVVPVLLAVAGGRIIPGGVYVGPSAVNLGLGELGGKLVPLADFQLVDQAGAPLDRGSLLGRDTVIAAFHTTCHETCPLYTAVMMQLRRSAPTVRLVEVTTDPATDTPAALAAYAAGIGADWTFATGSADAVTQFWAPFGVPPATGDSHTSALVLVDAHGYIRTAFTGVPDVGGRLPAALSTGLSDAGRQLATGHGEGWGTPQVLESLRTIAGAQAAAQPTGGAAPVFTLTALDGRPVSLEEYRGRPVILNFWWSGCPPCREEMPDLERLAARHPGATLLLIDNRDPQPVAASFARSVGVSSTVLLDQDGTAAAAYGVAGFPTTVVVGGDGSVRYRQPGPVTDQALELTLSELGG